MVDPNQPILGAMQTDSSILRKWLVQKRPNMDVAERDAVVCAYTTFGQLARTGNLIPFAQGWKETAGFTSQRWVKSYNPAGLGATNDGKWGAVFENPAEGIIAQIAHLLAYAAIPDDLVMAQTLMIPFDPRLEAMTLKYGRGSAPRWIDLNGKWAVPGTLYGQSILAAAETILKAGE